MEVVDEGAESAAFKQLFRSILLPFFFKLKNWKSLDCKNICHQVGIVIYFLSFWEEHQKDFTKIDHLVPLRPQHP